MDIHVEPTNFNASQDLIENIQESFKKLSKYNDQIESMDVYLESLSSDTDTKQMKLKILAPGHTHIIEEKGPDFGTTTQTVFDRAKHVLPDQKEKDKSNRQKRPGKVY